MLKHEQPRNKKGHDFRDNPEDMDSVFLLNLSHSLYVRTARHNCTEEDVKRSLDLLYELGNRLGEHSIAREEIRLLKRDLKHAELIIKIQEEEHKHLVIQYLKIKLLRLKKLFFS